jgi:FlaA1/EpsC-like NDP-sugar epimerase
MNHRANFRLGGFAQALLRRSAWFIALFQAALIFCSLVFAWLLRFDFSLPYRLLLFSAAPILILARLAAIQRFKLLHGWWRYAGVKEVLEILKAVVVGSILFFVLMRFVLNLTEFPRSIYILEAILTTGFLAGVRLFSRVLAESVRQNLASSKKVVLIGAGFAAQLILRELRQPGSGYSAFACLDDDESKVGLRIHGVPVVGTVDQLAALFGGQTDYEVIIAVPSASSTQMQRFVTLCEEARLKFRTVPALRNLIAGEVIIKQLREVKLEDLLGRDPIAIDLESVRKRIQGHAVMVTGAAGSIGSELCRQILDFAPASLIGVDQSETGIFYLQLELSRRGNGSQRTFYVTDIRDSDQMRELFARHQVEIVFHAAAYKHVPVMESNVEEAVKNNIFALPDLLEIAEEAHCGSFVMISSDKAVNPTSVMGVTKRVCELILASRPPNSLRCVSVRFGNVLGSSGSVVPVFQEQLRNHLPLTITHPEIKRFFMTTQEAVALVLQAFAIGEHGDVLVLDMGEPICIRDLARNLIRLSGKREDEVGIHYTGLRPGEKLIEELFGSHEVVRPTSFDKIKRTRSTLRSWGELQRLLDELRLSMNLDGDGAIRAKLKEIVPEYDYETSEASESTAANSDALVYQRAAGHK